jgi:hypothetical protein
VSYADYKNGERTKWVEGEELTKALAAQATIDLFTTDGISTDTLMHQLKKSKQIAARKPEKKPFNLVDLHVGMGRSFDDAKRKPRAPVMRESAIQVYPDSARSADTDIVMQEGSLAMASRRVPSPSYDID